MRWALEQANHNGSTEIEIDLSIQLIQLNRSLPSINNDLKINGAMTVINAGNKFRIMNLCSRSISLLNLSFINGLARGSDGHDGAGGFAGADGDQNYGGSGAGLGGAIFVKNGSLSLQRCEFRLNKAIGGKGYLSGEGWGGAVFVMNEQETEESNKKNDSLSPIRLHLDRQFCFWFS